MNISLVGAVDERGASLEQARTPQSESATAHEGRLWDHLFFGAVCLIFFLALIRIALPYYGGDHYVYLANHIVHGNLNIDDLPGGLGSEDYVVWDGHKYLALGPLPAVVLIPFLPLLNSGMGMVCVGYLFTAINVILLYLVLGQIGVADGRRKWVLLLFFGGSVYLAPMLRGASWYFAHILAITCLLAAIHEMLGKGRTWLVGLFLGLAGMTRLTCLFALPFFLWLIWRERKALEKGSLIARAGMLLGGLAGPIALLLAYNYARFGNPLESGYALAVLGAPVLEQAISYGLFSPMHIPKNLFMMLLQGPLPYPSENAPVLQPPYLRPSQWGMGLFFTSPALIYVFKTKLNTDVAKACLFGLLSIMVPVLTYYGVGYIQFGFRYALDFMPFLILLAARGLPSPMSNWSKVLVLAGVLVNIWGAIFFLL